MTMQNNYDDDDGRIVADMAEIERPPLLFPRLGGAENRERRDFAHPDSGEKQNSSFHNDSQIYLDREERRALIGGALSAGLLVVGAMAVGFAALILFILKVWG